METRDDKNGYYGHMKISRFVFEPHCSPVEEINGAPDLDSENTKEYMLQWSRACDPRPIDRTRWVPLAEILTQGVPFVDFGSHSHSFAISEGSMHQVQERIVLLQLWSRQCSRRRRSHASRASTPGPSSMIEPKRNVSFGNSSQTTVATSNSPELPKQLVASGTVDLAMFVDLPSKGYAVSLESNFFTVGRLHFNFFLVEACQQPEAQFKELAHMIVIEKASEDLNKGTSDPTQLDDIRPILRPKEIFQIKVTFVQPHQGGHSNRSAAASLMMDGSTRQGPERNEHRTPMDECNDEGTVVWRHAIAMQPCAKVRFELRDDSKKIGSASCFASVLTTSEQLPHRFALPISLPRSQILIHFSVKEDWILRSSKPTVPPPFLPSGGERSSTTPTPLLTQRPRSQPDHAARDDDQEPPSVDQGEIFAFSHSRAAFPHPHRSVSSSVKPTPVLPIQFKNEEARKLNDDPTYIPGHCVAKTEYEALQDRLNVLEQMLFEANDKVFMQESYIAELLGARTEDERDGNAEERTSSEGNDAQDDARSPVQAAPQSPNNQKKVFAGTKSDKTDSGGQSNGEPY